MVLACMILDIVRTKNMRMAKWGSVISINTRNLMSHASSIEQCEKVANIYILYITKMKGSGDTKSKLIWARKEARKIESN